MAGELICPVGPGIEHVVVLVVADAEAEEVNRLHSPYTSE
jgi:hypothetical protein